MPILLLNYCCLTISQYSFDVADLSVTSTDAQNFTSKVIQNRETQIKFCLLSNRLSPTQTTGLPTGTGEK